MGFLICAFSADLDKKQKANFNPQAKPGLTIGSNFLSAVYSLHVYVYIFI